MHISCLCHARMFHTVLALPLMQYDFTELFKIVTIDTGFHLFPVEILLIECINSHQCAVSLGRNCLWRYYNRFCAIIIFVFVEDFFFEFCNFLILFVFPNFLLFFVFSYQEISVFFNFLSCFLFFLSCFFNFIVMSLYSFVVFLAYFCKN